VHCIGILGGMGPAATIDFMSKLLALTPASCDQDHLPIILASLPQIPDRSAAILGIGEDPLPILEFGVKLLNRVGVDLIVIPCATSHHWHQELSAISQAPIMHIANAILDKVPSNGRLLILATRGTLASGFFQRTLSNHEIDFEIPCPESDQSSIDECIRLTKAGQYELASRYLDPVLKNATARGITSVIMGCTEIPIAAAHITATGLNLIDCTLELARHTVDHALKRGWNKL
jgi:aspartate racemase